MIKLNKNQRKFFEKAIDFYGESSREVNFKSLKNFADINNLIIPVSALKKHCRIKRGRYDLTLVGITPSPPKEVIPDFPDKNESVIKDMPIYADTPKKQNKRNFNITGLKPIKWRNPVYVLLDSDYDIVSIHHTACGAYKNKWNILHSSCDCSWKEVEKELKYTGKCIINSTNSNLWCVIVIMEMKE